MAIKNGSDLILKVSNADGGTENKLMHATSCTLDIAMETIDISTKDSAGYRELLGGQKSFTLSADGLMDFNSTGTDTEFDELFETMKFDTFLSAQEAVDNGFADKVAESR